MHPDVLRFGDSLRAYGLGAALLVLAVAAIWRLAHDHSRRNVIVAAVMVFLCAHSVYYNALFLLAAAVAMTIVCARRRQWKPVAILAVIGVVTALSGYPYLATLREMSAFNALLRYPEFGFAQLLGAVRQTLDAPFNAMSVLWLALAGGAVCVALWCVVRRRPHSDVAVYAAITLVLGVGGYAAFLLYARYPAWTTYFIVPMALAALCIDVSFAAALRGRAQWVQAVAMCVLVALGGSAAWRAAHLRMTNIDAVASVLNRDASDSDLVVVMHWTTGLSFQRYYDGAAPWMTLPPLEDHSVHRFDQLKTRMASETAINPVLLAMERTMKDGGTIYLVRHEPPWPSNRAPVFLPAAPHPVTDWLALPYVVAWKSQVDFFVAQFADRAAQAPLPDVGPVQPHERMWLAVVRGWREKPVR